MWSCEWHIAEERSFRCVLADKADGRICNEICCVSLLLDRSAVHMPVRFAVAIAGPVVRCAIIEAFEFGKALRQRMPFPGEMPHMPFAKSTAMTVASLGEQFGQGVLI